METLNYRRNVLDNFRITITVAYWALVEAGKGELTIKSCIMSPLTEVKMENS